MNKVILKIGGMSCSACANRVEKYLNKQDGIKASVNLVMAQALIEYDDKLTLDDLSRFISESGYTSLGVFNPQEEDRKDYSKYHLISYAFLIIVLMYVSMSHMLNLPVIPFLHMIKHPVNYGVSLLILTIPFLIYGFDIIKSGIIKIISRSPNMDSLVTIGVSASFLYSLVNLIKIILGNNDLVENLYFESVAMIIYFIKLGRFISQKSQAKTKEAIKELVQITPKTALIKTKDGENEVTIDEIQVGDILICKPGAKIAVDGVITKGNTHLDEAFITGESTPSKKKEKDIVMAGAINIDGFIEYKAERIGPDSTISEIVKLVVEATNTKAPIARIADKVAGYFVPGIMVIAILTFIIYLLLGFTISEAIIRCVTVLVVACPCALGLATPLAIVTSEGLCASIGILVKNSETLENAHKIDTIVFDKTGTLTYGDLRIDKFNNYSDYSDSKLLKIMAGIEHYSNHPIAKVFSKYYDRKIKINNFSDLAGMGLYALVDNKNIYIGNNKLFKKLNIENKYLEEEQALSSNGNSIIYVIEDGIILALIGVKDVVRDNVKDTINTLKIMNKEIIMLSGDNEVTASIIGKSLGIDKVIADVLPTEKESVLNSLMNNNHKVMMVGDGINDALSLTRANIGVSLNSGTDIAGDSADVILMNNDLSKIIDLIKISEYTIKIVKQNLFWAFFYNICMIPMAIGILKPFGIKLTPMFASLCMTVSSLTVVFNSLRLKLGRNDFMFNKKIVIKIDNMSCKHCAKRIEDTLKEIDNIKSVKVNLNKKNAVITYKDNIDMDVIARTLENAGYKYVKE